MAALDKDGGSSAGVVPRNVRRLAFRGSSGLPVVVSEHPAQTFAASDLTGTEERGRFGVDDLVIQPLVVSLRVIIEDEL